MAGDLETMGGQAGTCQSLKELGRRADLGPPGFC
jgi:hypothetical protein